MATKKSSVPGAPQVVRVVPKTAKNVKKVSLPKGKAPAGKKCEECGVANAFHAWKEQELTPALNWQIDFSKDVAIPAGKRAVIELVTATIQVPVGEGARLRMNTSLGIYPSNLDFFLVPQGVVNGREMLVATHSIRAYSDHAITFNVHRDNAYTQGYAVICISGYMVDV
jgi:hypothetical protein